MNKHEPSSRLIEVAYKLQQIKEERNVNFDPMSFVMSAITKNADDTTIEKIIADYEQHIVKYTGEDHLL